jgi:hypothetical protein
MSLDDLARSGQHPQITPDARTHSSAICSGWSSPRPTTLSAGPVVGYIEWNAQNSDNLADLGAPEMLTVSYHQDGVAVRVKETQHPRIESGAAIPGLRHTERPGDEAAADDLPWA